MFSILIHGDAIIRLNSVTGETWFINGTTWTPVTETAPVKPVQTIKQVKVKGA